MQITGKHSSGIICLASYKKLSSNLCSCFQPAVYYHAGLTHTHRNTQKQTQILSQQKDYIPIMSQLPPKQTNTNLLLAVVPQGVLYLVLYLSNYKYDKKKHCKSVYSKDSRQQANSHQRPITKCTSRI